MEICFYNMNHIGDIYFSYFFINIICKMNLNVKFLYYFINGDIFFKKIPNIERISPIEDNYLNKLINGNPPENLLNNSVLQILINNNMQSVGSRIIECNGKKILFINTWCISSNLKHEDYDIQTALNSYQSLINIINSEYSLNLNFKINNYIELLHDIDSFDTNKNLNINEDELKDTIFVFNFKPRSLDFNMNVLNYNISKLSKNNKVIISTYEEIFENNENIKFADKNYNIYPNPSCKNLIDLWEIAYKCKKIILVPSGSCWTFFHKLPLLKENQIFIFNSNKYCNQLNKNINLFLEENKNLIKNF